MLGATGSIGASTIDLLKREPERYRVEAVTAHRNAAALARWRAKSARDSLPLAIRPPTPSSRMLLGGSGIEAAAGERCPGRGRRSARPIG